LRVRRWKTGLAAEVRLYNTSVDVATDLLYHSPSVRSSEFKRWLEKQGCTFESGRGSHLTVRCGDKVSTLPMHGKGKELGTGLMNAIKRQLGLK
jgi:mRNA interferase HicA